MIQKYTGWEMYPLEASHRSDGHVYVRFEDVDLLKTEIVRLRSQIADAELSLRVYDDMGVSEYWLRHPDSHPSAPAHGEKP